MELSGLLEGYRFPNSLTPFLPFPSLPHMVWLLQLEIHSYSCLLSAWSEGKGEQRLPGTGLMVCGSPESELLEALCFPMRIQHNTLSRFLGCCPTTHFCVFSSPFVRKVLRGEQRWEAMCVLLCLVFFSLINVFNICDFNQETGRGRQSDELLPANLPFPLLSGSLKLEEGQTKRVLHLQGDSCYMSSEKISLNTSILVSSSLTWTITLLSLDHPLYPETQHSFSCFLSEF